jgi:crotonobetainyl-CoA hydratase
MRDAAIVRELQPGGHGIEGGDDARRRHRRLEVDLLTQAGAAQQLHHHVGLVGGVEAEVEQADDVGKVESPASGFGGITSRLDNPKPLIAAVNGLALGGGFEIVLACDLVIASEKASFGLPEPRVGLAALAGGLHRLPRQSGMNPAMGMLLTGRRVEAREAQAHGIVNEVVAPGELMAAARRWADAICECSPVSVRTTKRVVLEGLEHASLEQAMGARYDAIIDLIKSEDFTEGPLAFSQKRKPNWKGR